MSTPAGPVAGTVAVVCDVGPRHGVGHLMRCVALSEEFAARGHAVVFVADAASVPFAARQLATRGFASTGQPTAPAALLATLEELGPDVVVIDSYQLADEVYAGVADRFRTVALVDGDPGRRRAHVYLDQNIDAEHDSWPLPPGSVRLAGLDYALMRSDVLAQRPDSDAHADHEPPRVLAFFGGTDAFGAGPLLTAALVATGRPFELTVVAPTGPDGARWEVPESGPGQRIVQVEPTDELPTLVAASDLVVSAAGTSSWELLCLRAACAFVAVADNQEVSYRRVVATGAVAGLGLLDQLRAHPAPATDVLSELLSDAGARARLRTRAGDLVDGRGRVRVVDAVLSG